MSIGLRNAWVLGAVMAASANTVWANSIVPVTFDVWGADSHMAIGGSVPGATLVTPENPYWAYFKNGSISQSQFVTVSKGNNVVDTIGSVSNYTLLSEQADGQPGPYLDPVLSTWYDAMAFVPGARIFGDTTTLVLADLYIGSSVLYPQNSPLQLNVQIQREGTVYSRGSIVREVDANSISLDTGSAGGSLYVEAGDRLRLAYWTYTNQDFYDSTGTVPITEGPYSTNFRMTVSVTPEPTTLSLLALGGMATLLRRRRRIA